MANYYCVKLSWFYCGDIKTAGRLSFTWQMLKRSQIEFISSCQKSQITNLTQKALQSVQHMAPSIINMRKTDNNTKSNGGGIPLLFIKCILHLFWQSVSPWLRKLLDYCDRGLNTVSIRQQTRLWMLIFKGKRPDLYLHNKGNCRVK